MKQALILTTVLSIGLLGCVAHAPIQYPSQVSAPPAPTVRLESKPAPTTAVPGSRNSTTTTSPAPAVRIMPAEEPAEANYSGVKVRRWSAVVSDLNATIELFTEVLGFELGAVTVDPPESYVYPAFNLDPEMATRHANFHAGSHRRAVSVVEAPGVIPKLPQEPRSSALLLNANGRFDVIVNELRARGYETLPISALGSRGVEVAFLDRDGHLYALYQIPYQGQFSAELGRN